MEYKIIFSDIDGTILNENKEVSQETIQIVKKIHKKLPFVLISARMPAAMRHLQKDLGVSNEPIIAYNGGLVMLGEKSLHSTEIPLHTLEELINFNKNANCHLSLYYKEEWYVPSYDYWAKREEKNTKVKPVIKSNKQVLSKWKKEGHGVHKIMVMGNEQMVDDIRDFLTSSFPEELHLYRSKKTYLEIAHKGISKFSAIQFLLKEHFHLKAEESIAYGDNYNDVEMIKNIGLGIAVANARKEVLEVAKQVTPSNVEDGVAKSLKNIFKL